MGKQGFERPQGPLGVYAEEYRRHLVSAGYGPGAVQHRNTQFALVSRWLESEGLGAADLDEAQAARFAAARRAAGRRTWVSPIAMRTPLRFLRDAGVVPEPVERGAFGPLLVSYARYLREERGLAPKTVRMHTDAARRFCTSVAGDPAELARLGPAVVTSYLVVACTESTASVATSTVGAVASLLRYLHVAGVVPASLSLAVPRVARRRSGPPAPALTPAEVSALLASCDRQRGVGRRDYAMVLLFSRLGLRPCEVAQLRLDDIDWRHGELLVRGKGNRHEQLPLTADVGAAIAAYLAQGRPAPGDGCRALFLRSRAPWAPLCLSGVQTVVRDASRRAGLGLVGPRRLRRTAATQAHRGGMPLAGVAQLLRHSHTRVTALYVDVDEAALRGLARPWPGGAA